MENAFAILMVLGVTFIVVGSVNMIARLLFWSKVKTIMGASYYTLPNRWPNMMSNREVRELVESNPEEFSEILKWLRATLYTDITIFIIIVPIFIWLFTYAKFYT